ncbi:MAG: carboxymuconolactone decarboxylase family protein, partial [Sphingobium sp.]
AIAREVLKEMNPLSPLLTLPDDAMPDGVFAPEFDYMVMENMYFDLWARTDVLDRKMRSVVTLGLLIGLGNQSAIADHVPVALRNGLTVPELEELIYQASTYLGYISGGTARATIGRALQESDAL